MQHLASFARDFLIESVDLFFGLAKNEASARGEILFAKQVGEFGHLALISDRDEEVLDGFGDGDGSFAYQIDDTAVLLLILFRNSFQPVWNGCRKQYDLRFFVGFLGDGFENLLDVMLETLL